MLSSSSFNHFFFLFISVMPYSLTVEPNFSQSGHASVKRGSRSSSTKELATGPKVGLLSSHFSDLLYFSQADGCHLVVSLIFEGGGEGVIIM